MLYCTRQHIVDRLGGENRLPTIEGRAGNAINEAQITQAISQSSAVIDVYVQVDLLSESWQQSIEGICTSIAVYYLTRSTGDKNTDTSLYDQAVSQLKEMSRKTQVGVLGSGSHAALVEPTATKFSKSIVSTL